MNTPFFCITSDIDWASEFCINDIISICKEFHVKPTLFATHKSQIIDENLLKLYPGSESFRSHAFVDNSHIVSELKAKGIKYDSNLCLYLQPNLIPLNLGIGGVRFPVFWEDDVHWSQAEYSWNFDDYRSTFLTAGLKILNFHPFLVAANVPNNEYYQKIKGHIKDLSEENIEEIRYKGKGTRTFLIELLQSLSKENQFNTLKELYEMFPISQFLFRDKDAEGRETIHTDDEYKKYWHMSDQEKQELLKDSYQQRNPTDPYATSRDIHLRELEIEAIKSQIKTEGSILDLGCGNGYTLLSIARDINSIKMTGVDYSSNLIQGANDLLQKDISEYRSKPEFVLADAIEFIENQSPNSYDYVICERFIQNLPSKAIQQKVLNNIYKSLNPNGILIMCEGEEAGFDKLNDIRGKVGLEIIPKTSKENISAIRIDEKEFEEFVKDELGFEILNKLGFSDYFLVSRVFHPLFIYPQKPKFDSKINEVARNIQINVPFKEGLGSNVVYVLKK